MRCAIDRWRLRAFNSDKANQTQPNIAERYSFELNDRNIITTTVRFRSNYICDLLCVTSVRLMEISLSFFGRNPDRRAQINRRLKSGSAAFRSVVRRLAFCQNYEKLSGHSPEYVNR